MLKGIKDSINASLDSLAKGQSDQLEEVESRLRSEIERVNTDFQKSVSEFEGKFMELRKRLEDSDEKLKTLDSASEAVVKRMDTLEGATAMQKSATVTHTANPSKTDSDSPFKDSGLFLPRHTLED